MLFSAAACGGSKNADEQARAAIERAGGTTVPATTTTTVPPADPHGFDVDTTGGDLPRHWPHDFPLPDGYTVVDSAADGDTLTATVRIPDQSQGEVESFFRRAIHRSRFRLLDDAGSLTFATHRYDGNVIITRQSGQTVATLTVVPKS